ncbi:tyrosine-type recombinase/integrase [Halomarina ordinaria]|uniref:Tyrosine-type recombinase/integrase n=1 Tax=Halomarina ordinaria TaxID=3033939 RepID=A0ABD5UCH7_9EURY|nr:tyrosine-type recombinase/integrase [Halomarina sp. PSRA2]
MSGERPVEEVPDPVEYFLEDLTYHGRSERTRTAYERVLRRFEAFLAERGTTPADADRRVCLAWVHGVRADHAPSTVATYATYVHRFYGYMTQAGVFDANPMALVMAEMDESVDTDPERRELGVSAMRTFVASVTHPLERAVILTLLKTGMRVGEACNLDLRDVHLSPAVHDAFDVPPRPQLDNRPDSVYVASDVARGQVVDGEERTASNKRKRATVVPVDAELRRALVRWLTIRPDARSPAEPLFVSTGEEWGERLTTGQVRTVVRRHAEAHGWYRTGGGATENVTPHYFRHFFTTHLRDRTGDRGIVKYLRGDVATDIIDTYTHNWGDRVREVYEANIYALE